MKTCTVVHPGWTCAKLDGHNGPCAPAPASSMLEEVEELRELARQVREHVDDLTIRGQISQSSFGELVQQLEDCERMMPAGAWRRRRTG